MQLLEEAIKKNTCPPREGEHFTQTKKLRVSGELEGDSQLGVLLFVGLSIVYRIPRAEAVDFIGIETEEYDYKASKFITEVMTDVAQNSRIDFKARLVNNYIKIHAKDRGILIDTNFSTGIIGR